GEPPSASLRSPRLSQQGALAGGGAPGYCSPGLSQQGEINKSYRRTLTHAKPPYSYISLITMAIQQAPKPAALAELHPPLALLQRLLCQVARSPDKPGKGSYWALHPNSGNMFENGCYLRRQKRFKIEDKAKKPNAKPSGNQEQAPKHPERLQEGQSPNTASEGADHYFPPSITNLDLPNDLKMDPQYNFNHPFSITNLMSSEQSHKIDLKAYEQAMAYSGYGSPPAPDGKHAYETATSLNETGSYYQSLYSRSLLNAS
uniref:Fork-head domain-containing protein n=1 Tax=Gopherus evgoodei TaxID=1825980 RepID=A0A8C4W6G1_9SAUR